MVEDWLAIITKSQNSPLKILSGNSAVELVVTDIVCFSN